MILQIFSLGEYIDQTAFDSTVTCNDTVAEECSLVHAEVRAAVCHEHVEFLEAAFVEEHGDPFAGSVFALLVLRVDSLFVLGILAQLGEHTVCGLGVEEGDVQALCAFAGSLVDESYALGFHFGQSVLYAVLNCES